MSQAAFVILFVYIRSFNLTKYDRDFDREKRESKPNEQEFKRDIFKVKQQQKVIEKHREVEANYFLERRTYL